MSIEQFIPEVWSARILEALQKQLVYANLLNRDCEGEISQYGDTVHIFGIGPVTISDYIKNTDMAGPERLDTDKQSLLIDQSKSFNVGVDDIDRRQARADLLNAAASTIGYEFGDVADIWLAKKLAAAATIKTGLGTDAAPLAITEENAYETIVRIRTALNKANVAKEGRWVVMPPEFEGYMLLDPRFAASTGAQAEQRLMEGTVFRAAGLDIYTSNNVPNTSNAKFKVLASTNASGTYAEQILKTEAYRPEKRMEDALKGLHVYGAQVTRPDTIACATVDFAV